MIIFIMTGSYHLSQYGDGVCHGSTIGTTMEIPVRGGGSIPICSILEKELGIKIIFMGFGLDNDNLHSPNEKYNIENYYKGIETIPYFHKYFAEMN